ncbi:MAG: ABC transporter permease [Acidimicrobiales bacterium]
MWASWVIGRASWRRRAAGLVGLGLLAGIVGGVVIGGIGGIRRSSTTLDRLIAATHLSPVVIMSPALTELSDAYVDRLRSLPEVESVTGTRQYVGRDDVGKNWWSLRTHDSADPTTPVMVSGRAPDPRRPDDVIVSVNTARLYDLHVGSRYRVDLYSFAQLQSINLDTWTPPEGPSPLLRVVGIYRDPLDAARSGTGTSVRASASFDAAYGSGAGLGGVEVRLRDGVTEDAFARALRRADAAAGLSDADGTAPRAQRWLDVARSGEEQSRGVITIGLGAFAAVASVAGVVALAQSLRRWVYPLEGDLAPLRAMGATRAERRLAVAVAALPHVAVAVPVAIGVAYAMSGMFPFGVLADVEPTPGLRADLPLLATGAVGIAVVALVTTWLVASAVERGPSRRRLPAPTPSVLAAAELAGTPIPATVGMRFVLRPGSARRALPVNTAIAAAVLAIAGLTAATVFTASLDRLVATPARYGNNWDLSLELLSSPTGRSALAALADDADIAAVGVSTTLENGVSVAGRPTKATVVRAVKGQLQLQVLRGRPPSGPQEVVLGPELLRSAGAQLGDTVRVRGPEGRTVAFTVVGTALSINAESDTYPSEAFFGPDADPTVIPSDLGGAAFSTAQVTFADGVDESRAARRIDDAYPFALMNESFPRPPAGITNVAQLSMVPRLLAAFLALLGFAALVHALAVTVRSRRRDLGILRSLGFTRAQAAATIVSLTSTIVLIGVAIGIPLGLVLGASGWRLVAQRVHVAPDSLMPFLWIGLAAVVALVTANLVALLPARAAAHLAPGDALRTE